MVRFLICLNSLSWQLNSNLTYNLTFWELVSFYCTNNMLEFPFFLEWIGALELSLLLKLTLRKLGPIFYEVSFFLGNTFSLKIYRLAIHVRLSCQVGATNCYHMLSKLQKWVFGFDGFTLAASHETLAHHLKCCLYKCCFR